jgi:hypothetical protein
MRQSSMPTQPELTRQSASRSCHDETGERFIPSRDRSALAARVMAPTLDDLDSTLRRAWDIALREGSIRITLDDGSSLSLRSGKTGTEWQISRACGKPCAPAYATRTIGPFTVVLNEARGYRPTSAPGTACSFACGDPAHPMSIVPRKPRVVITEIGWAAFCQGFPTTASGHWLVVPFDNERFPCRPQRLDPDSLRALLAIAAALPSALVTWSSLGDGGGTVNHLHGQIFFEDFALDRFTVTEGRLRTVAGHPATLAVFDRPRHGALRDAVVTLDRCNVPFNLLLRGSRAYLAGKRALSSRTLPITIAACELAGLIVTSDAAHWRNVTLEALCDAYARTTMPLKQLAAIIPN